ncbi:outer membrane protein assembly factor BamE [Paracoccus suum]|uniref:Outer membrane protein assembly factor BamE n=1 Tax=Paracoccus suum TaxID=2259340 RepID=A0A344PKV3_9RHOB|nr:outer membrane protein assembly factor BamE [Paracoccus suum]AXC50008.1 outer membrane protein assembly factor BamE [Paracoccus suum]
MNHARLTPLVLLLALILSSCAPVFRNHGYVPDDQSLASIVVGQTTRDEVPSLIGSPSAEGVLTGGAWFYVKSRFEHFGPYRPAEIKREVVAISFAESGTVANVERFGLERGRVVVLSQRVTDPGVSAASALRQILGNFGKFRADQIFGQ